MIERYTLPEMGAIWSDDNRFSKWLQIEVLACEAQADLGKIPKKAVKVIKEKAAFQTKRILEIEEITHHDVLAFLTNVNENVGDEGKYIHLGMTSSDILDTTLSIQMVEASDIILKKLYGLAEVLKDQSITYKDYLMMGRTHGIHAEPVTLGLKFALWYDEVNRGIERLNHARENIRVGKISGAVGTFANIDPQVEEYVCSKLGLKAAPGSTQILQRDRHAEYITTLAVIGSSLDKFATEIRNLQRTDIHEVEETFVKGQKGSSAMPHKKNPIICERVAGMARLLRGNAQVALENVALWHERDITHSSVERVIIPDSTIALDYMLQKFTTVMKNLTVNQVNMEANLNKTLGLIFSQRVMLTLVEKGMLRETAYALVQRNSLESWRTKEMFIDLVKSDKEIMALLKPAEVDGLFDYSYHSKNIDYILRRTGVLAN